MIECLATEFAEGCGELTNRTSREARPRMMRFLRYYIPITETLEIARDVARKLLEAYAEREQSTTLTTADEAFDCPLIVSR